MFENRLTNDFCIVGDKEGEEGPASRYLSVVVFRLSLGYLALSCLVTYAVSHGMDGILWLSLTRFFSGLGVASMNG